MQTVWCAFSGRKTMVQASFPLYAAALAAGVAVDNMIIRDASRLMVAWPEVERILDAKDKALYKAIVGRAKKDAKVAKA